MADYRLSQAAETDVKRLLATSVERWGLEASRRYGAKLLSGMRRVAADPEGRSTQDRSDLAPGTRTFHLRHVRSESREMAVNKPVHVLVYRVIGPGLIEIVRVLHERMDIRRHVGFSE